MRRNTASSAPMRARPCTIGCDLLVAVDHLANRPELMNQRLGPRSRLVERPYQQPLRTLHGLAVPLELPLVATKARKLIEYLCEPLAISFMEARLSKQLP